MKLNETKLSIDFYEKKDHNTGEVIKNIEKDFDSLKGAIKFATNMTKKLKTNYVEFYEGDNLFLGSLDFESAGGKFRAGRGFKKKSIGESTKSKKQLLESTIRKIIRDEIKRLNETEDGYTLWFLFSIDSHGNEWTKKFISELEKDIYKVSNKMGSHRMLTDDQGPSQRWGFWFKDRNNAVKFKKYLDSIKSKYVKKLEKDVDEDLEHWDVKLSTGLLKR